MRAYRRYVGIRSRLAAEFDAVCTLRSSFTTEADAALVVLLADVRAGNVTGADAVIDGGLVQAL